MSLNTEAGLAKPKVTLRVNTQILQDDTKLTVPDIPGSPINTRNPIDDNESVCSFKTAPAGVPGAFPDIAGELKAPAIKISSLVSPMSDSGSDIAVPAPVSPLSDFLSSEKSALVDKWFAQSEMMENGELEAARVVSVDTEDDFEEEVKDAPKTFIDLQADLEEGNAPRSATLPIPGAWTGSEDGDKTAYCVDVHALLQDALFTARGREPKMPGSWVE